MPTLTRSEELLKPISAERPGGEDLRLRDDEWVKLRTARPNTVDAGDRGIWTPVETNKSSWPLLRELASDAIEHKSKDLRIAIWLTEANVRIDGFAGLGDSLHLIREMLTRFWDAGLYPSIEDNDLENRSGPLEWLNEKLADLIRETPLTKRSDRGEDYSFRYYQESRQKDGKITVAEFETAVRATSLEFLEELYQNSVSAASEMSQLNAVCTERFAVFAPSLSESRDALDEARVLLERVLRDRRPAAAATGGESNRQDSAEAAAFDRLPSLELTGSNGSSWEAAEKLAHAGKVDEALAEMTVLAATEGTGRARFQRKLVLADICLATKRDQLAKVILEELAELIEKHQLETWETSGVVSGVWTRLYGCYRNEKAGIADVEKAAVLFLKLCRLDPWQALKCHDTRTP